MRRNAVSLLSVLVLGLVFIGCSGSGSSSLFHKEDSAPPPCVAAQNEQCPSDEFVRAFDQWQDLKKQIDTLQKDPTVVKLQGFVYQFTGMSEALQRSAPAGYKYDADKKKFTLIVSQIPTTPAPAPAATPNAAAPKK